MTEKYSVDTEQLKKEIKEELLKREILMGLEEDEIDLFELFHVLKRRWKLVIVMPFLVACIAALYSLTWSNYFKASSTIFVHFTGKRSNSMLSSTIYAGMLPNIHDNGAEYLMVYLNSRTMSEYIINKFGIATSPAIVGDEPDLDITNDAILKLIDRTITIEKSDAGLITISAETMDPHVSAQLAADYVNSLAAVVKGPQKEKRVFIQQQLDKVKIELAKAEDYLKDFQDKYKIFALEEQTVGIINKLAKLEAEKIEATIALQMQESLLRSSGSVPELVKIEASKLSDEARIIALEKEIVLSEKEIVRLPQITMDFVRLQRNMKMKANVFKMLTEHLETAKIAEAEQHGLFEVIDVAVAPDTKSKPRRSVTVIMAGLSAGALGVFASFLFEFIGRRKKQEKKVTEAA